MDSDAPVLAEYGLDRYRTLLRRPEAGRLLGASVASRFPLWITAIALVIFVQERTGSYLRAGLVLAAYNIAMAVASPMAGRIADRFGYRRTLLITGTAYGVLMGFFVAAVYLVPENLPVLMGAAALASAVSPPLNPCVRVMWGRVGAAHSRPVAYALDHVVTDLMAVGGRLAAAMLLVVMSAGAIVAVCVAVAAVGSVWLGFLPAGAPAATAPDWRLWGWGAISSRGVRALVLASTCVGYALGTLTLCVLAVTNEAGRAYLAPIALAVLSGAGVAGGLWYGGRANPAHVPRRFAALICWFAGGVAVVAAATSIPSLCLLVVIPGVAMPATMSTAQLLVDLAAAPDALTEARAWVATALSSGMAAGSAVAGALINVAGWRTPIVVSAAVASLGGVVVYLARSTFGVDRGGW